MSTAEEKKERYEGLVEAGAPDTYGKAIKELVSAYNNNTFSYDPDTDKAFQNYAKMMREQGSRAAEDTIGMASSMTGGYGNSYAATAAQSVQDQYLETIDAKAEEYYDRALADFNDRQAQLLTSISLMKDRSDTERENWESDVSRAYEEYADALALEKQDKADALALEKQDKADALERATVKAQYGDASDLETLLGMEPGTVQNYLMTGSKKPLTDDLIDSYLEAFKLGNGDSYLAYLDSQGYYTDDYIAQVRAGIDTGKYADFFIDSNGDVQLKQEAIDLINAENEANTFRTSSEINDAIGGLDNLEEGEHFHVSRTYKDHSNGDNWDVKLGAEVSEKTDKDKSALLQKAMLQDGIVLWQNKLYYLQDGRAFEIEKQGFKQDEYKKLVEFLKGEK